MKSLVTLLAGIFVPVLLCAQWLIQNPGFTEPREIRYVHALDDNAVWIIAIDASGLGLPLAEFSRTNDGGSTWIPGAITTEEVQPSMIFALSDQKAFVPVYKSSTWTGTAGMFVTHDGGVTWTRQTDIFTDPTAFPDIVHFFDVNNGVAVGDPVGGYFDIYTTSNGGTTWTRVAQANIPDPLAQEYGTVMNYSASGNSIWVPTTKGRMLFSSDLGHTWNASVTPYPVMYNSFIDENHGVILDHQDWYYTSLNETYDGGYTWSPITSTGPILNWDIDYVPGTVGTFVTAGAVVNNGFSFSINAGHDWHWAPESQGIKFFFTDWVDNTTGWAGGFNDVTQRAVIYKYTGPGLTDLMFSTLSLDFGEVDQGETSSRTVTISNYGTNIINLMSIYSDNMDYYSNTPSAVLNPGQSINVEVIFQPSYVGLNEGHLIVESDHPELSYIEIALTGTGVDLPDLITDPTEFNLTMYSGEEQIHDLTLTNNLANTIEYEISTSVETGLLLLGWNYGSTPLDGEDGILGTAPDQAMFIKDFTLPQGFGSATLNLGFDDGCRVWINGQLALDYKNYDQWLLYWNTTDDISYYLREGKNRISIVVFNGVYGGGGFGGFDCQLTVDGTDVIKRGDENPGAPEAMWYYYGETGMMLVPSEDISQHEWWEMDYGRYDWLKLSRSTGQQFFNLGWVHESTPCPGSLLNSTPDMAQFIKDIEIPAFTEAMLYLGFDDGCRVWINGEMKYDYHYDDHGLNYWDAVENISGMLIPGRNCIAVEVYNGIWYGGGGGGFDCQLTVDGVDIIKRGDQNPGVPEAMWYMYGAGGQQLIPPDDNQGNKWFTKDYAYFDEVPNCSLTGAILPDESEMFKVFFDAAGLPEGTYETNINVDYSFLEMQTQVPVTLNIFEGPHCTANPEVINMDTIFLERTDSATFVVSNTGSQLLTIYNIFNFNYNISIDPNSFTLGPGEMQTVKVYYNPSFDDKYLVENIYILSDDPVYPEKVVSLIAYGMHAPDLVIPAVDHLYSSLAPGGFESQNLHIENWGSESSILNFILPQADSKKLNEKINNPVGLSFFQKEAPMTMAQRTLPPYYEKDIKSHKDLVIKTNDPAKSGVAGDIDIFSDDMEYGFGNWTTLNFMETALQWHLHHQHYYSENTSWWCGNETTGDYVNGSTVREAIISGNIILPPVECSITLEFHEMWEVEDGYDQCYVDISTDGGYNWDRIREGIPGSSGGWITTSLDISNYWNQTVKVRFFFDTGDDIANNFPGWFIDDVRIYVTDFDFLSVSPGEGSIPGGGGFDITVNFDASGYEPGYYPGFILILSNDPDQPQYYLPAYMEVAAESFRVSLNVLLEGAYNAGGTPVMTTAINGILPLEQPYNSAPWNYNGGESVPAIPSPDIVDWVLVELRDAPDAASATPATIISQHAAFLRNDGQIVGMDGMSELTFYSTITQQLFGVVWHRNHLGVMSAFPLTLSEGIYYYYFSTEENKVYRGSLGHKMIGDGVWGMIAGDMDASLTINNNDKTVTWETQSCNSGYLQGDADLNEHVDNNDKNDLWLPNINKSCQVPQ